MGVMSQCHSESLSASDEMDPLERVLLRAGIIRKTVSSTGQRAQPPWLGRLFFDSASHSLLRSSNPVSVVKTRLLGQSLLITSMWCSGRSHGAVQTARVSVSQIWVPTLLFAQRVTSGNWLSSLDHIHMSSVSQSLFMCVLLESRSAEACIRLLCLPGLISSLAVPSLFWGGWGEVLKFVVEASGHLTWRIFKFGISVLFLWVSVFRILAFPMKDRSRAPVRFWLVWVPALSSVKIKGGSGAVSLTRPSNRPRPCRLQVQHPSGTITSATRSLLVAKWWHCNSMILSEFITWCISMGKFSINISVYPGAHFMQEEKDRLSSFPPPFLQFSEE